MTKHPVLLPLLLLLFLAAIPRYAAAQAMHITGTLLKNQKDINGKKQRTALSVPVHIFDNASAAKREAERYKQMSRNLGGADFKINGNDYVVPDYEGHFEADVSSHGALLIANEGCVSIVNIQPQKLDYQIVIEGSDDGILISNVDVYGKRAGLTIQALPPVDEGPVLHWDVTVSLPRYYTTPHTRLIFQPMVVDCQTEDTVQYLEPLIYEGGRYHAMQVRRMSYDYQRNDSLSSYYIPSPQTTSDAFTFHWTTTYAKPDFNKSYKWVSVIQAEDYTHVFFRDASKQGTCNSRKPWKMLDVSMARKEMPLTQQFYEQSRSQLREIPRDLKLTFEQGRDVLTPDPQNQQNVDRLVKELRSYGRSLMNFSVQGTASPEGDIATNTRLADKRARKALSMVGSYIRNAGLEVKSPIVYTWEDVADSLEARGMKEEAQQLRDLSAQNKQTAIRQLRFNVPQIDSIMQNQRLMRCTYTLRQNKILDPDEVLWTYYNDASFAEGGDNQFSNGDYYNLFSQITDSAELRRLTLRAWRENKDRITAKYSPFAAFLANRMACYAIEHDSTDLSILAPFVDMKSAANVTRPIAFDNSYMYTVNRTPIVANQAIMYFKSQKLGEAAHLASKLPNTPDYRDIKMFTDLETLFFKSNKTPEEQQRAEDALRYALNTTSMNRAVLTFELAPELGKNYDDVEPLIDSLPDDAPQKWYMKGVIAAQKNTDEQADNDFMALVAKYGTDKALQMTDNDTPAFLAYMQHCFDLDKSYYKKYFVSDANISDETRKKYPYDEKKADTYREKFITLTLSAGDEEKKGGEDEK